MTWLERTGRGLDTLVVPLLLLLLIGPALFVEVWTDKTFIVSHGTFILTVGWGLIVVASTARALRGEPVFGGGGASRTRFWLMLLAGWIAIASVFAYQPAVTWFQAVAVLTYMLVAQSVLDWLEPAPRRAGWLILGLAGVVLIQTVVGALQYFKVPLKPLADAVPVVTTGEGVILPGGAWLHDLLFSLAQIADQGQVVGTLGNVNYLAEFLVLALPVLLGAVLSLRSGTLRWLGAGALGLSFLVFVNTGGRGALLGLLVGGAAAALLVYGGGWLNPRRWWHSKRARVVVILGAVFFTGALALAGARFQAKMTAVAEGYDDSTTSRLANWKVATGMALDRPVFGTGLGGYKLLNVEGLAAAHPDGVPMAVSKKRFHHAHNEPLQVLVELGLPGALLLLGVLLAWVREVRRNETLGRPMRLGLLWGAGGLLVAGTFGFPFHIPLTALVLVLVLALGVAGGQASTRPALALGYRPVYAIAAIAVLGTAAVLVFQKQAWPDYVAHRYVKVGEQLVKGDHKSPAVPAVLALVDRHMRFKGEVTVPEMKVLLERGQHEQALQRYEANAGRGLGMDALYWKGRALEKLGRDDEALEAFTRVMRFYPKDDPHHVLARRMIGQIQRKKSPQAPAGS